MVLLLALLLSLCMEASLFAQGRGSAPAAPSGLMPASWWNKTTMRSGKASPSRYYAIRSDLPEADTREIAKGLDLMYVEYQKRLAGLEARGPGQLNVFIFSRRQDYLDTLRTQFGVDATGSGGMFFISPRGAGLAFFVQGVPRTHVHHVIQHEGFHQVAYTRFANDLPPWVNEGMAEFFGEAVVIGNEVVIGQSSARTLNAVKAAIEAGTTIPFLEMVTMTPEGWNGRVQSGSAALQYQQAWSMVHFLVYGEGGRYRGAFEQYLRHLNNGSTSVDAFMRAFGTTDLTSFEQRWKAYAAAAQPSAMLTAVERLRFLAEGMLSLAAESRRPKDFEELKAMLMEKKFTLTIDHHGHSVTMSASDPGIFDIPDDEHSKEPPVFALEPFKARGLSLKERKAEETNPTPPSIVTLGLRPRELAVQWGRVGETFEYEIGVK